MSLPRRKHTEVMREHVALAGLDVVDVGCGDGALVRFMTRQGARAIGIECSEAQLAKCHAAEPAGDEAYRFGIGQELPLEDRSQDLVVYFNALHHVPVESQAAALQEAARVLRPGGRLYIMEPLAEGAYFEATKVVEDETEVRAKAAEAIEAAAAGGFAEQVDYRYAAPVRHESFAEWRERSLAIDPRRQPALDAGGAALQAAFEAAAEGTDRGFLFWQASRLNLLALRA